MKDNQSWKSLIYYGILMRKLFGIRLRFGRFLGQKGTSWRWLRIRSRKVLTGDGSDKETWTSSYTRGIASKLACIISLYRIRVPRFFCSNACMSALSIFSFVIRITKYICSAKINQIKGKHYWKFSCKQGLLTRNFIWLILLYKVIRLIRWNSLDCFI